MAKKVSLSLHKSFCLNRESKVKGLANQVKKLPGERDLMRAYEQLKAWEKIVISSDEGEELASRLRCRVCQDPVIRRQRGTKWRGCSEIGS